ncbi:MAG TPA: hypothetical protein DEB17_07905 [Chlorobaculum sp.]|uniref:Exonuclease domain-containing protein n=1 Tax=Chlorobaculum tepidum (strain ATCC 49652 / DSM 12025 / NBRC 103806 / TLS) TaxID=194439 RepID=Q8KD23_CHLTE|nr:hypothetical protein CT1233 [Chlorobaculum tepidum TLS]HBU23897.1 hypothetical protein [Chlorobaculum sp.]
MSGCGRYGVMTSRWGSGRVPIPPVRLLTGTNRRTSFAGSNRAYEGECCCSLLLSRRIYQEAPNHKLQMLVSYAALPQTGRFHRAQADAEMTAFLWMSMIERIRRHNMVSLQYSSTSSPNSRKSTGCMPTDIFLAWRRSERRLVLIRVFWYPESYIFSLGGNLKPIDLCSVTMQ